MTVSLGHGISLHLFWLFQTHWVTLQVKYSTRSALASTAKYRTEAVICVLQMVTYTVVEKEWRTKENKCKLWENHDATFGAATVGKKEEQSNVEQKPVAKPLLSYACLKALVSSTCK